MTTGVRRTLRLLLLTSIVVVHAQEVIISTLLGKRGCDVPAHAPRRAEARVHARPS